MLPNHPAKQVQLQKLHSIKKVELRANFMFSTKLLKKYPEINVSYVLVELRGTYEFLAGKHL
jgi:hypothetical protein